MAAAGITKRWVRGSLLITVLVILAAEVMFLYTDYRELYGGVQRAAESRFSTIAGRLQATGTAGDANETSESRGQALRRTVEQFDEKDKFEFMLLDAQGVILATSSGTMTRDLTDGTDFLSAQTSASGKGNDIFTTPQGERVMAVTELVPYAAGNVAAMRLVTSLTLVDRQWWNTVTAATGVGALVLVFTIWSGLFFVRSIVRPLGEIEATATKIAKGDLQVRLPDNRYNDEVGRLCKTINQMAEDLAETERLKNEFISSVSHELRTPIAVIQGYANLLNRWGKDDPATRQEAIDAIRQEADSMKELVEQLLFLARGDNDSMHIEMETFDLTEVAAEVLKETGMIDQTHTFSARWEGAVPVCADVGLTKQALRILVDNSIKYTPAGGHITLSAALRDGMARLSVQDEGQGIDAGSLPHVFDRFYRADKARTRDDSGYGLGLAIAHAIAEEHGGNLAAASDDERGTTFTLTLPTLPA